MPATSYSGRRTNAGCPVEARVEGIAKNRAEEQVQEVFHKCAFSDLLMAGYS